jgi:hypothetical protein
MKVSPGCFAAGVFTGRLAERVRLVNHFSST